MKLKLLSTGIAALALLPITTAAISQTASAATVNTPVANTQTVKPSTFAIFNISGQATTSRNASLCYYYPNSGAVQVDPVRTLPMNTTFQFDKIAYTMGLYFYHIAGDNDNFSWIDANDCY